MLTFLVIFKRADGLEARMNALNAVLFLVEKKEQSFGVVFIKDELELPKLNQCLELSS